MNRIGRCISRNRPDKKINDLAGFGPRVLMDDGTSWYNWPFDVLKLVQTVPR